MIRRGYIAPSKINLVKEDYFMNENGWTIVYYPWEDDEGKPRVAGRFKTTEEKDKFLEKIYKPDSGWLPEELSTVSPINDYNYMLPY